MGFFAAGAIATAIFLGLYALGREVRLGLIESAKVRKGEIVATPGDTA